MPTHPPRICAVITSKTCREARASLDLAAQKADIAELRLDYLTDFDFSNPESLAPILEGKRLPVIITCRIPDEGGFQIIDDSIRLPLLIEGAKRFADYCDIEASRYQQAANQDPDESKLILSWHNFTETPADIEQKYTEIVKLPAAVHKLATRANDISDVLPIFRLLDRAQSKNRNLIALAMGPRGLITRILGPSRGAFLTYASIEAGAESAPGQITLDDLNSVFRLRTLKDSTRIAGVIGAPVGHSASPAMHNSAFASFGINAVYLPLEVRDLEAFFRRFVRAQTREFRWEPLGFSVTIPHKIAVVGLLDEIDETARAIGAVNTVVVREGRLLGYNTDAEGATLPLEAVTPLAGRHCALIGAGGSARAVLHGLIARGARPTLFTRNLDKVAALTRKFGITAFPVEQFARSDAEIVINCTPVGMRGHSQNESPVDRSSLRGRRIVYDLVYNPLRTRLLDEAEAEGCQTISGIEMLAAQAALQFQLWTGAPAPSAKMRTAALEWLKSHP